MSGSEGGEIYLWNLKTKQLIKRFLEHGVYSLDKYTMSNPCDGRFSPDGSSFVIGSQYGTISLFSLDSGAHRYAATRVEQFYIMDDNHHNNNVYYEGDNLVEPQVCGYNLIPYETQPPSSTIGPFRHLRRPEDYERQYIVRQEIVRSFVDM